MEAYHAAGWFFPAEAERGVRQPAECLQLTTIFGARKIVLHLAMCSTMKTNITLKLDADLLREARVLAAEENTSISAMLAARLELIVRERRAYERARRRALARLREGMDLRWTPARSRDELHER